MSYYRHRDLGRAVLQRRWTPTAIECLERNCICEGCYYKEFFEKAGSYQKCQMKAAVLELKRTIGNPPNYKEKTYIDDSDIKLKETITMTKNPYYKPEISAVAADIIKSELTSLSDREKEVAGLMLDGKNKNEILKILNITTGNLSFIQSSIYKKTRKLINYQTHEKQTEFVNYFLHGSSDTEEKLQIKSMPISVTVKASDNELEDISCNSSTSEFEAEDSPKTITMKKEWSNIWQNDWELEYTIVSDLTLKAEVTACKNMFEAKVYIHGQEKAYKLFDDDIFYISLQEAREKAENFLDEFIIKTFKLEVGQ